MPASDRIGESLTINGRLHGSTDLTVDGRVEGEIELPRHELTVGPKGKVEAQVACRSVVVLGAPPAPTTYAAQSSMSSRRRSNRSERA